jgi:hypothetical protein
MTKPLEFITIYPKINVYRNVFNDVDDFLEKAKKLHPWEQWYTFGNMISLGEDFLKFEKFPTRDEFINSRNWQIDESNLNQKINKELCKEVGEIFYDVTSHFLNMHPDTSLPNYTKQAASINKYIEGSDGISENYSMNYHTDFVQPEKEMPGNKFGITTTFYLNDNYENGEICFTVNDEFISHKPKRGDVIVFPSTEPYYHGVRKSFGNDRYMIRCFWQFEYDGSKEWLDNEKKYGKELWSKMEKDRIKQERFENQIDSESVHHLLGKDNGKYL